MSEELMQKYEQIFYNQLNFMSSIDKMKFYSTQFNEIKPAIEKTIDFVDNYDCDWGDYKEKVLVLRLSNCLNPSRIIKETPANIPKYFQISLMLLHLIPTCLAIIYAIYANWVRKEELERWV